mmetsp:Transcript_37374/g.97980  ORF Transcript_37374/g.97980 Transcript_37374/m.97980 type:complete len:220 (+) Transcript_37374:1143-1802(+)
MPALAAAAAASRSSFSWSSVSSSSKTVTLAMLNCEPMLIPDLSCSGVTDARNWRIRPESTVSRVLDSLADRPLHSRSITFRGPTPENGSFDQAPSLDSTKVKTCSQTSSTDMSNVSSSSVWGVVGLHSLACAKEIATSITDVTAVGSTFSATMRSRSTSRNAASIASRRSGSLLTPSVSTLGRVALRSPSPRNAASITPRKAAALAAMSRHSSSPERRK